MRSRRESNNKQRLDDLVKKYLTSGVLYPFKFCLPPYSFGPPSSVGHSSPNRFFTSLNSFVVLLKMMLASPLYPAPPPFSPQHTSEDPLQYRPSRDLEAFNNLLPPPIEFIEGSSSGALAIPEGKYHPINTTPKALKINVCHL